MTDLVSFAFDAQVNYDSNKPLYISAENPAVSLNSSQTKTVVQQLIAGFRAAGLRMGETVLVCVPNNYLYVPLILGIVGAGGVFCGLNPAFKLDEFTHLADLASPRLIITSEDILPTITRLCEIKDIPRECVFVLGHTNVPRHSKDISPPLNGQDSANGAREHGFSFVSDLLVYGESPWRTFTDEATTQNTPAAYFTTSGTTGLPKLASLSHYALIAQHISLYEKAPYEAVRLACLPLFHVFGVAWALFNPLRYGEPVYIMPRFSRDEYVSYLHEYAITETYMAPPMVHALNRCERPLENLMATIQYVGVGGAAIDAAVLEQLRSYLQPGATVTSVWGMTEFGPAVLFRWGENDKTGSIGRPMKGYETKLSGTADEEIVGDGRNGELLVRSTGIMIGYLGLSMVNEGGWFRTGDIAQMDGGKLYVIGRSKELIKVKGWQVAPAELETVILQHPDVVDCAVVGTMSVDLVTEVPRAYVVKRKGKPESLVGSEIYDLVRHRLVSYKRLAGGVIFVESIPRTPSGKVQRFKLLERKQHTCIT
ncbi:adenylate-forming enzyme AfeA [Xylariales sp. PMI_506]|nr:adenylate-forming enzyme AfeA [Xylariales sp. PMI_506]